MSQPSTKDTILQELYTTFFVPSGPPTAYGLRELVGVDQHGSWEGTANLYSLLRRIMVDETAFWNTVNQLVDAGLIRGDTYGNYIINAAGVLVAEEQGLAPQHLVERNQSARINLLRTLANVYHQQGFQASIQIEELSRELGSEMDVIKPNLVILNQLQYTAPDYSQAGTFRITYRGMQLVTDWQEQEILKQDFEDITVLQPQPRGKALQRLFARAVERHGWAQEEGVRTPNEEMDVIVHKGREYYVIECKWEKKPIATEVVHELYSKLSNRDDARGIIVSMSGFTRGAVKQAEDCVARRIILLFGDYDTRSIIDGVVTFEELLDEKYKEAVTKRKITYR